MKNEKIENNSIKQINDNIIRDIQVIMSEIKDINNNITDLDGKFIYITDDLTYKIEDLTNRLNDIDTQYVIEPTYKKLIKKVDELIEIVESKEQLLDEDSFISPTIMLLENIKEKASVNKKIDMSDVTQINNIYNKYKK